jgi:hypothetical protein
MDDKKKGKSDSAGALPLKILPVECAPFTVATTTGK